MESEKIERMEKKLLVDAHNRLCELTDMKTEKVFIINTETIDDILSDCRVRLIRLIKQKLIKTPTPSHKIELNLSVADNYGFFGRKISSISLNDFGEIVIINDGEEESTECYSVDELVTLAESVGVI